MDNNKRHAKNAHNAPMLENALSCAKGINMEMSEFDRYAMIAMGSDVGILAEAKRTSSLDECFAVLSKLCPSYWIYKGGHHVAIHRETGLSDKGMRLALFTVA